MVAEPPTSTLEQAKVVESAGVALSSTRVVTKNVSRGANRLQCVGRAKRFQCLTGACSPTTLVEGGVRRVGAATAPRAIRSIGLTLVQQNQSTKTVRKKTYGLWMLDSCTEVPPKGNARSPVTDFLTVTLWLKLSSFLSREEKQSHANNSTITLETPVKNVCRLRSMSSISDNKQ